jgi:hypothetical protein
MAELERSDAEGHIKILLEEYRSLRDESKQRISERMALLSLLIAAAAFIASSHSAAWAYAVAGVFLLGAGAVWWRSGRILNKLGKRLSADEQAINAVARKTYTIEESGPGPRPDYPLGWETQLQRERNTFATESTFGKFVYGNPGEATDSQPPR